MECISRDLNPGYIDGNDVCYHQTLMLLSNALPTTAFWPSRYLTPPVLGWLSSFAMSRGSVQGLICLSSDIGAS